MKSILSHSDAPDTLDAAHELIATCREKLAGETPKAGLLFCSVDYDHAVLLKALRAEWPDLPLIGGSSDGELSSILGFRHDSAVLTLFAGDDLRVHAGVGRRLSDGIDAAVGQALLGADGLEPNLCVTVFAPSTNASAVVRGLNDRLEAHCPVVGGLSGDHREFSHTREFYGDEVLSNSLPVLLISGDFRVGCGHGSGWFPIGAKHRVTRAEGNVVYEIEGRPAIELYQQQYGALPSETLSEYPLAVYGESEEELDEWALRAVMNSDQETGSLYFAGEVPENSFVSMTEVLPEGILSGTSSSLAAALEAFAGDDPELAFVFSCAARKWVLGTKAAEEIDELRKCAARSGAPKLQIAGLYVFGEIAPAAAGWRSRFHNETCVSLVLGK